MKVRIVLCAMVLAALLVQRPLRSDVVAYAPDLDITYVNESGWSATVHIMNKGTAPAAASSLYLYRWNGASWVLATTKAVPAIAAGATAVVNVIHSGVTYNFNLYYADGAGVVNETNEGNNSAYYPEPAG
jgi:hypothetical protein